VKKTDEATPLTDSAAPRRRGRRTVEYVVLVIGGLILIDALVGEKGMLEIGKARRQHAALEHQVGVLRADNTAKRDEARQLRESAYAIEELARRELGLIKPGEKLFIISEDDTPKSP
jgi:cell division protein FtsB